MSTAATRIRSPVTRRKIRCGVKGGPVPRQVLIALTCAIDRASWTMSAGSPAVPDVWSATWPKYFLPTFPRSSTKRRSGTRRTRRSVQYSSKCSIIIGLVTGGRSPRA